MKVEVQLYATLSWYLPNGAENRKAVTEFGDGLTVGNVIDQLGIPKEHPNMALVNGIHARDNAPLKDGDVLAVFPPLAGGRGVPGRADDLIAT